MGKYTLLNELKCNARRVNLQKLHVQMDEDDPTGEVYETSLSGDSRKNLQQIYVCWRD